MKLHACLALGFIAVAASAAGAQAAGGSSKAAPQILAAPPTPAPVTAVSIVPAALAPPAVGVPAQVPVASAIAAPAMAKPDPAHEAPAPTIADLVARHAHDNGVPVGLANAVIRIESRFNPKAIHRGALGLMQIRAGTARSYGFGGNATGLLTPDTNLRFGMKVLARAYRASSGDVCRTLAFYQSGHEVHRFTSAQRSYCLKARAAMARPSMAHV